MFTLKECFLSGIVVSHIVSCSVPNKQTDIQEAQQDITNVIHAAQADVDRRVHESEARTNMETIRLQQNMDILEAKLNKMNGLQLELMDSFINWNTTKNTPSTKHKKNKKY